MSVGGPFDRRTEILERLHQHPGEAARQTLALTGDGPPPSRWTLRAIQATFPWLHDYTLSGVWRLLQRYQLRLRSARVQLFSPDPDYAAKVAHLCHCLQAAAAAPERVVLLFLDEMGYGRWPDPAPDWGAAPLEPAPVAERAGANDQQWRIIGVLNALTGQVNYLDGYIVGRAKVIALYRQAAQLYPQAERIYVVQDNWSIHRHPDVVAALAKWPHLEVVWLPTYAPWLNPIEKLWRWLRQEVLKMHRLAADWVQLKQRVHAFLAQFAHGSPDLLRYVGLLGDGLLARALRAT